MAAMASCLVAKVSGKASCDGAAGCDIEIREQHNGGGPNVDQVVRACVCGVSTRRTQPGAGGWNRAHLGARCRGGGGARPAAARRAR
eukprot:COSAG01_NODE_6900_length_3445_cov_135.942917_3_plen_86_part_01